MELGGHTALVCGASKGIGKAVARSLAEKGAELLLLARDQKALDVVAGELKGLTKVYGLAQDLSDSANLKKNVAGFLAGRSVSILINNCGGPASGPLLEASEDQLLAAFRGHVLAAQILTQLVVPSMRERHYGRIINVISTSVKVPIANLGVSNTIRAAMAAWAKTLAGELGPMGVTVNNVLPGYTSTERLEQLKENSAQRSKTSKEAVEQQWLSAIPAGRFAEPSEVAAAVAFLASPAASYINGINLPVDGGRTGCL